MRLTSWIVTICGAWLIAASINVAALDTDLSWTVSLGKQKEALAAKFTDQPRILLVGGSQTHYSVSARRMEAAVGCPTVNLGLHAGLGLNTLAATAERAARPGDIVVFFPEYALLEGDGGGWLSAAYSVALGRPGFGGDDAESKVREFIRGGVISLTSLGKSIWVLVFNVKGRAPDSIGPRGDAVTFLFDKTPRRSPVEVNISQRTLSRLTTLRDNLDASGAHLVIALPWRLIGPTDRKSLNEVRRVVYRLRPIADIIGDDENLNLHTNINLFSDTDYHASREGRERHTARIVAALRDHPEHILKRCNGNRMTIKTRSVVRRSIERHGTRDMANPPSSDPTGPEVALGPAVLNPPTRSTTGWR